MKTKIYITVMLFAITFLGTFKLHANDKENKVKLFPGSLSAALTESAKLNKPVFINAHTSWCSWCRKFSKNTLTDPSVINLLNKNFITIYMDMEKGEGPSIGTKYNILSYPTLLFLNSKGEVINRVDNYVDVSRFLIELKKTIE